MKNLKKIFIFMMLILIGLSGCNNRPGHQENEAARARTFLMFTAFHGS